MNHTLQISRPFQISTTDLCVVVTDPIVGCSIWKLFHDTIWWFIHQKVSCCSSNPIYEPDKLFITRIGLTYFSKNNLQAQHCHRDEGTWLRSVQYTLEEGELSVRHELWHQETESWDHSATDYPRTVYCNITANYKRSQVNFILLHICQKLTHDIIQGENCQSLVLIDDNMQTG